MHSILSVQNRQTALTAADPMKKSAAEAISLTPGPLLLREAPGRTVRALRKMAAGEATARIRNRKHCLHVRWIPAAAQDPKILIRRIRQALRMMTVLSEKVQVSCAQKDQSEQEEGTENTLFPFFMALKTRKPAAHAWMADQRHYAEIDQRTI